MRELNLKGNEFQLNAEQANEYFSSIRKDDMNKKTENFSFSTNLPTFTKPMFFFPVGTSESLKRIKFLNNSNAEIFDGINNILLIISSLVSSEYLSVLPNKCYSHGCFPASFKIAKLVPIHKAGDKSKTSNCRPISPLTALSKILEK